MHLCKVLKYTSANDGTYSQLICRIVVDYPHTSRLSLSFRFEQKFISHPAQACQGNEVKSQALAIHAALVCRLRMLNFQIMYSVTFSSDSAFAVMRCCILDHKTLPKTHQAQQELSPFSVLASGITFIFEKEKRKYVWKYLFFGSMFTSTLLQDGPERNVNANFLRLFLTQVSPGPVPVCGKT